MARRHESDVEALVPVGTQTLDQVDAKMWKTENPLQCSTKLYHTPALIMKKKLATRHLANGLAMAMSLAMAAGLVYLTVLISSNSFGDDSRVKRSLLDSTNEFLFKKDRHRVHWTKPSSMPDLSSSSLPNPSRFDKKSPLEYIFISVKTSSKFHLTRLQVIINTWFNLAPNQVRILEKYVNVRKTLRAFWLK